MSKRLRPKIIIATIATLLIIGFTVNDFYKLKGSIDEDTRLHNGGIIGTAQADFYWASELRIERWFLAETAIFDILVFFIATLWIMALGQSKKAD